MSLLLLFTQPASGGAVRRIYVKRNGAWTSTLTPRVKNNGAWSTPSAVWYRTNGTWTKVWGGAQLWTPAALGSALALWLDANDSSTITLNGSTVSQWRDKSGSGNNATQGTAANQPTYSATGFNSKPALIFDGTSDWMSAGTGLNLGSQHFIVAAIKLNTTGGSRIIGKWNLSTVEQTWLFSPAAAGHRHMVNDGAVKISQYSQASLTTLPALYGGELQAGVLKAFVNGVQGATTLTGVGTPSSTNTTVTLGRLNTETADYGNMTSAEFVIANGADATVANREKAEGYLAWKWGLEANLPAGHPYKSTPPTV